MTFACSGAWALLQNAPVQVAAPTSFLPIVCRLLLESDVAQRDVIVYEQPDEQTVHFDVVADDRDDVFANAHGHADVRAGSMYELACCGDAALEGLHSKARAIDERKHTHAHHIARVPAERGHVRIADARAPH